MNEITFANLITNSLMPRYFAELQYKGSHYHGWQIQHNARGIQEIVNEALSVYLSYNVETTGCGRTDTGVHALQYFAHFDIESAINKPESFCHHVNCILPVDIKLFRLIEVAGQANARYDATSRSYVYFFYRNKNPFANGLAAFIPKAVDIALMNQASQVLLKHTNFKSFSRTQTQVKSYECQITRAHFSKTNDLIRFDISANRFLRGMVRAITGTLIQVGCGALSLASFEKVIESQDRRSAGRAVPPEGLYLSEIHYPYIEHVTRTFII